MRRAFLTVLISVIGTLSQAETCEVPGLGRGGDWVKIQEIERSFRCLIDEVETLKRQQRQIPVLEQQVAELRRRVPAEYVNTNGKVIFEEGRLIGKATITLDASRSGKGFSLPVAQEVLEELCARTSCHVLLSMTVTGVLSDALLDQSTSGPCGFSYKAPSGEWSLAAGCSAGEATGVDGDGASLTTGGAADIILSAGEACLFTDTEINSRPGQASNGFAPDTRRGVFLAAVPERRPDIKRPFQCVLEIFRTGPF